MASSRGFLASSDECIDRRTGHLYKTLQGRIREKGKMIRFQLIIRTHGQCDLRSIDFLPLNLCYIHSSHLDECRI